MKGYKVVKFTVDTRIEKSTGKRIYYPAARVITPQGIEKPMYALVKGAVDVKYDKDAVIKTVTEAFPGGVQEMFEQAYVEYTPEYRSWWVGFRKNGGSAEVHTF